MARLYNQLKGIKCLTSVARTNGTATGDTVDRLQGANAFDGVLFVILTATLTDGVHTITVQESDDNSSWSDAATSDQSAASVVTTTSDDNVLFELGYHGVKRYCRMKVVTSGATTGGVLGAVAILGDPRKNPAR